MELSTIEVKTQKSFTLPFEETLIMPIADIQYGATACDIDRFKRHIAWGVEQKNAYFIGLGDYVDYASPSNRNRLKAMIKAGELYDTAESLIDQAAQEHLEELTEILAPTKGRWLGLLSGHHYWEFADGTTSDMRLANYLQCAFLGTCAIVNIRFSSPKVIKEKRGQPNFNIWLHHGVGSGTLQSAPLNKLERMAAAWDNVDVFLMAHHHKKVSAKIQRIKPRFYPSGKHDLVHRNIIIAGVGGFLRGYMAGQTDATGRPKGTYVEQGMMTPVTLGGVVIWARPRYDHQMVGTTDLDISL